MADSLRQDIIDAVNTRIQTITTGNGYETDAGLKVFWHKKTPMQQSDCPGLVLVDIKGQPRAIAFRTNINTIELTINGFYVGETDGTFARKLIADIVKCIGVDVTWGGLAEDSVEVDSSDDIEMEHMERKISGVEVVFEITYVSNINDPYN